MTTAFIYNVPTTFSRFPGGRKRSHGPKSGQEFWEEVTSVLLRNYDLIRFELTGAAAYSTGFLDEAFGEIGREIGLKEATRRVEFVASDDPQAVETIWHRIAEADAEASRT